MMIISKKNLVSFGVEEMRRGEGACNQEDMHMPPLVVLWYAYKFPVTNVCMCVCAHVPSSEGTDGV